MSKVYICTNWFPEVLEKVSCTHETKIWSGEGKPPRDVLLREIRDIEGLLTLGSYSIDSEIIKAAPKLRVISNCSVGYGNIDIAAATARGIPVGYTPYALAETTADFAFGLLLACARRIVEADAFVRQGKWIKTPHSDLPGVDISGATLGIVGLGRIGMLVAKRAKAFNMRVLYYAIRRKQDLESLLEAEYISNLHEFLSLSDFISIHAKLTEHTRHMIGPAEFAVMKPTTILINTSRGTIVDQRALYQALKSCQILRAALDVTEVEPIPSNDPLLTLDNLLITPHIGAFVPRARREAFTVAAENLIAGLAGNRVLYCANPSVYGSD